MSANAGNKKDVLSDTPGGRIHVMTIDACNNNCVFCCSRHPHLMSRPGTHAIDRASMARECKKQKGIDGILFTGGESTLHTDLPSLMRYAGTMGYRDIALQTNGRMLKYRDLCVELLESGLNEVDISLHGSRPRIHDALTRSPGSFEQAYAGLLNVVALKKDHRLRIHTNFTVTKLNYKDIPDYLALLLSLKRIDGIVLNTLMFTGNAALFFNRLFISYTDVAREVRAAVKRLCGRKRQTRLPVNVTPMPLCLMQGYENYVGVQEVPVEVKDDKAKVLRRSGGLEKNIKCLGCRYERRCGGIDSYYARKVGWSEIHSPGRCATRARERFRSDDRAR